MVLTRGYPTRFIVQDESRNCAVRMSRRHSVGLNHFRATQEGLSSRLEFGNFD
jgi:hypothetical protein